MSHIRIKVNFGIPGYEPGQIVPVEADERGTPLDFDWRRRLTAAKQDGCCEVVKPRREPQKTTTKQAKKTPEAGAEGSEES